MEKAKHVKKREDDCEYFIDAHLASRFLSITRRLSSEAFPAGNRPSHPIGIGRRNHAIFDRFRKHVEVPKKFVQIFGVFSEPGSFMDFWP